MKQISVVACHFAALVLTQGILLTFAKAEGEGDPKSKLKPTYDTTETQFPTIYKRLGGTVKFRCKVEPSGAKVSWLKNGKQLSFQELPHFKRKKKKASKKTFSYEILVFTAEQNCSGKYSCIVKPEGEMWEAIQVWKLQVGAKKTVTVLHKDIGMAVRFECNVKPWIRVKWKKDGERFVLKKHPHFRSIRNISYPWSGSTSSLLFDARLKDSGEYECMGNYNGIWKKRKEWTLRVNAVTNLTATSHYMNAHLGWWIEATWGKHLGYTDGLFAFVVQWQSYPELELLHGKRKVNATKNAVQLHVLPDTKCTNLSITVYGEMYNGERTREVNTSLQVGHCLTTLARAGDVSGTSEREQSAAVILTSVVFGLVLRLLSIV